MTLELLLAAIAGALWVLALGFRRWVPSRSKAKVVEAERFVVRNRGGKEVASFGLQGSLPRPDPQLVIHGPDGESFVSLGHVYGDQGGPHLLFFDGGGGARISLGLSGRQPELIFRDGRELDSRNRVQLQLGPDGSPLFSFFDERGALRAFVGHHSAPPTPEQLTANADPELIAKVGGPDEFVQMMQVIAKAGPEWSKVTPGWSLVLFGLDGKVMWTAVPH